MNQPEFNRVKTIDQQDIQLLHRIRQRRVQQRTALINQIRGQLLEYGIPISFGVSQVICRLINIIKGFYIMSTRCKTTSACVSQSLQQPQLASL